MSKFESSPSLIDIGVNLTASRFQKDTAEVIERAVSVGVKKMIVTGTSIEESKAALVLQQQYPDVLYATAGIHPHHASEFEESSIDELTILLAHPQVVAVGECGLDYNRNFSTPESQRKCFAAQIKLAASLNRPVFLHQRDAHDDFVKIIKQTSDEIPAGVVHCFTGNAKELEAYIELGFYIGITGWICDERRGLELKSFVNKIPLDRLLLETDAPYLLPRDMRPKPKSNRNEPAYLVHIAEQVAACYGISPAEIVKASYKNSQRLFVL